MAEPQTPEHLSSEDNPTSPPTPSTHPLRTPQTGFDIQGRPILNVSTQVDLDERIRHLKRSPTQPSNLTSPPITPETISQSMGLVQSIPALLNPYFYSPNTAPSGRRSPGSSEYGTSPTTSPAWARSSKGKGKGKERERYGRSSRSVSPIEAITESAEEGDMEVATHEEGVGHQPGRIRDEQAGSDIEASSFMQDEMNVDDQENVDPNASTESEASTVDDPMDIRSAPPASPRPGARPSPVTSESTQAVSALAGLRIIPSSEQVSTPPRSPSPRPSTNIESTVWNPSNLFFTPGLTTDGSPRARSPLQRIPTPVQSYRLGGPGRPPTPIILAHDCPAPPTFDPADSPPMKLKRDFQRKFRKALEAEDCDSLGIKSREIALIKARQRETDEFNNTLWQVRSGQRERTNFFVGNEQISPVYQTRAEAHAAQLRRLGRERRAAGQRLLEMFASSQRNAIPMYRSRSADWQVSKRDLLPSAFIDELQSEVERNAESSLPTAVSAAIPPPIEVEETEVATTDTLDSTEGSTSSLTVAPEEISEQEVAEEEEPIPDDAPKKDKGKSRVRFNSEVSTVTLPPGAPSFGTPMQIIPPIPSLPQSEIDRRVVQLAYGHRKVDQSTSHQPGIIAYPTPIPHRDVSPRPDLDSPPPTDLESRFSTPSPEIRSEDISPVASMILDMELDDPEDVEMPETPSQVVLGSNDQLRISIHHPETLPDQPVPDFPDDEEEPPRPRVDKGKGRARDVSPTPESRGSRSRRPHQHQYQFQRNIEAIEVRMNEIIQEISMLDIGGVQAYQNPSGGSQQMDMTQHRLRQLRAEYINLDQRLLYLYERKGEEDQRRQLSNVDDIPDLVADMGTPLGSSTESTPRMMATPPPTRHNQTLPSRSPATDVPMQRQNVVRPEGWSEPRPIANQPNRGQRSLPLPPSIDTASRSPPYDPFIDVIFPPEEEEGHAAGPLVAPGAGEAEESSDPAAIADWARQMTSQLESLNNQRTHSHSQSQHTSSNPTTSDARVGNLLTPRPTQVNAPSGILGGPAKPIPVEQRTICALLPPIGSHTPPVTITYATPELTYDAIMSDALDVPEIEDEDDDDPSIDDDDPPTISEPVDVAPITPATPRPPASPQPPNDSELLSPESARRATKRRPKRRSRSSFSGLLPAFDRDPFRAIGYADPDSDFQIEYERQGSVPQTSIFNHRRDLDFEGGRRPGLKRRSGSDGITERIAQYQGSAGDLTLIGDVAESPGRPRSRRNDGEAAPPFGQGDNNTSRSSSRVRTIPVSVARRLGSSSLASQMESSAPGIGSSFLNMDVDQEDNDSVSVEGQDGEEGEGRSKVEETTSSPVIELSESDWSRYRSPSTSPTSSIPRSDFNPNETPRRSRSHPEEVHEQVSGQYGRNSQEEQDIWSSTFHVGSREGRSAESHQIVLQIQPPGADILPRQIYPEQTCSASADDPPTTVDTDTDPSEEAGLDHGRMGTVLRIPDSPNTPQRRHGGFSPNFPVYDSRYLSPARGGSKRSKRVSFSSESESESRKSSRRIDIRTRRGRYSTDDGTTSAADNRVIFHVQPTPTWVHRQATWLWQNIKNMIWSIPLSIWGFIPRPLRELIECVSYILLGAMIMIMTMLGGLRALWELIAMARGDGEDEEAM